MTAMTSRAHQDQQYANQANLVARQGVWGYRSGSSIFDVALDLAELTGDERILDVGCGNGLYLENLRDRGHRGPRLGLDYSPGMAAAAGRFAATGVADAQRLPVRTDAVDRVLCMHMLYHVPDVGAAVAELRRVLRPGGLALVATNGLAHIREAGALLLRAAEGIGVAYEPIWGPENFTAERAPEDLEPVFGSVTAHAEHEAVEIPDAGVVTGYLASIQSLQRVADPETLMAEAARLVAAEIDERGVFRLTRSMTVFVCR